MSVRPIFTTRTKALVAMIHVAALPGTPQSTRSVQEIVDAACTEAEIYKAAGIEILMIENMHDRPYLKGAVGPEITAAMTAIARAVRALGLPTGIQILAAANREALAVALAADLAFVRAEGFTFAHVADEGYIESDAAALLRYRRQIAADGVQIITDIKKKHSSHVLTADTSIAETAHAAEFQRSDAVVVTGVHTGSEADLAEVATVKAATSLPVIVGSGITAENIGIYLGTADAVIVGSALKQEGHWGNAPDPARIEALLRAYPAG